MARSLSHGVIVVVVWKEKITDRVLINPKNFCLGSTESGSELDMESRNRHNI